MIKQLPGYYRRSAAVKALYDAMQAELDAQSAQTDVKSTNIYITTTDDFTLHEKDVGIKAPVSLPEGRRGAVIARLQGADVLTVERLKQLALSHGMTKCSVIEHYGDYIVELDFEGTEGSDFKSLQRSIEEQKPAHIKMTYGYTEKLLTPLYLNVFTILAAEGKTEVTAIPYELTYLTDENGDYLTDENGNRIISDD